MCLCPLIQILVASILVPDAKHSILAEVPVLHTGDAIRAHSLCEEQSIVHTLNVLPVLHSKRLDVCLPRDGLSFFGIPSHLTHVALFTPQACDALHNPCFSVCQ
jgi:hypothetical protein